MSDDKGQSGSLVILLVEDDASHIALILRAFEVRPGWARLVVARCLQEARTALATTVPDLVLLDGILPDGRGLELLREDADTVPYPVVLMTSQGSEQMAVEAMKAGAVDYVVKSGVTFNEMPRIVEGALRTWGHIVERRRAEQALRENEERYRDLVENASDIVYTHDLSGKLTSLNRAAERITGYTRAEALGMNIADIILPEQIAFAHQMTTNKLVGSETTTYELDILTKHGQRLTLEVSSCLIFQGDRPVGVQGIGRDATERKRLEAHLRQAQTMQAIGTLAGGIAHDFNNILAAMLGYTELALCDVHPGSPVWQSLQEVLGAGQRAKALVQQILTFSRRTEQERKPLQLHELIKEMLSLLRASFPSTIAIRQNLNPRAGTVLADPTQMHQMLLNLCTNAEYAMRQTGGFLEVSLDTVHIDKQVAGLHTTLQPGTYVCIVVRDTGRGIAPEAFEHIFEPFFTTKPRGEGTGMGLALVHGIVTNHSGVITVDSAPGQGTTFRVYLPRVAPISLEEKAPALPLPLGTGCILFVDDEEALVRIGTAMLARLGYEVVARTSSVEALEAFRATPQRFDLVITDQTMPNMTGEMLISSIRLLRPDIPVILCTGFSHVMHAEKAQSLGVDAFLMKPLTIYDLACAVQQLMAPQRHQNA